jgi:hypothetical protein
MVAAAAAGRLSAVPGVTAETPAPAATVPVETVPAQTMHEEDRTQTIG